MKQASFAVLKSPQVPAILVETAFITNRREAHLLNSPDFQGEMAGMERPHRRHERNPRRAKGGDRGTERGDGANDGKGQRAAPAGALAGLTWAG